MLAQKAWRVAKFCTSSQGTVVGSLPAARDPCALYLIAAVDGRRTFLVAPGVVIQRLQRLHLLKRAAFWSGGRHGVCWLSVEAIEQAFSGFQWKNLNSQCASFDRFCSAVLNRFDDCGEANQGTLQTRIQDHQAAAGRPGPPSQNHHPKPSA